MDTEFIENEPGLVLIGLIIRIASMIYCSSRADKLHREPVRWGLFAFVLPIPAAIIISAMKPHIDWEKQKKEEASTS